MRRFLALVLISAAALVVLAIWVYPSSAHFRADNPFWNGLRGVGGRFDAELLSSLSALPSPPRNTVLIEVPYLEFSPEEVSLLRDYLLAGGTVLLMDDYGTGNQVLDGLGANMRFTGYPLLDPLFSYRNQWLPRIADLRGPPGVNGLVLNHATSLEGTGAEVIALSSSFSYLDSDGNGQWDDEEPAGPLPVAAQVRVGEGLLIMVSDPSILINSMLPLEDNRAFVAGLLELRGAPSRVLLDQSHLTREPLEAAKGLLATGQRAIASPAGLAAIAALSVIIFLVPTWRQKGASTWL